MAKTATVDLSTGNVVVTDTPAEDLALFLGGRGLGARLLYQLVGSDVDPLSPDNVLIFTAGLLTGTPWPTSSRLHVTFKSPLTGCYGYANSGGHFAAELKHAGYDALIVRGRSPRPVTLQVADQGIDLRDAGELWGKTTGETEVALLGEGASARRGRVACIGPAGENLVRIAAIMNERDRAAARCGGGAVMGSKNLKAVHITASGGPRLPDHFGDIAKTAARALREDPYLDGLRRQGTLDLLTAKNLHGDLPAKNHQAAQVPFIGKIDADAFTLYKVRQKGCYACPIRCSRDSEVKEGAYRVDFEGPEYETTDALGPMCWIENPEAILYANHLCNDYGLDAISTGVIIAFAMELSQRGLLHDDQLSLAWGDEASLLGLIERIAYRRGLGDILADGTRAAARVIGRGAESYAMQVKGMELPRQEPRFSKGFGLGHATSNRGADHLYALPTIDLASQWDAARKLFPADILPELMDPANEKHKPDLVVFGEHFCAITDALGICKFSTVEECCLLPEDLAPAVAAMLGRDITAEDLIRVGERIVNLERMYNVRQGLSRADDRLPARFTKEPLPLYGYELDPQTGRAIMEPEPFRMGLVQDLDAMLDRYYALRGWSSDGKPTRTTLARLNLLDVVQDQPLR